MTASPAPLPIPTSLFVHRRRPQWGLAILTAELPSKRRYQFQDGQLRTFKEGYYELFDEVDQPYARTQAIVGDLKAMLGVARARAAGGPSAPPAGTLVTFDDQLRVFRALYEDGFRDPRWSAEHREPARGRSLKRHRELAVRRARELLSSAALEARIRDREWSLGRRDIEAVFAATDLLGRGERAFLKALPPGADEALVTDLRDLLWGSAPSYEARFDRFCGTLAEASGMAMTWPLATALPALVHGAIHTAVKPSVYKAQARWMAPNLRLPKEPTGAAYERLRRMTCEVAARLRRAETPPRDLLDVHDFIWTTLRPKARDVLKRLDSNA